MRSVGWRHCILFAVTALAAWAPLATAANASEFKSEGYPATITGSGTEAVVMKFGTLSATCETTTLSGTIEEPLPALTVHPVYETNCKAFGIGGAVFTTTGCDYVQHAEAEVGAEAFVGSVDIACEGEKGIEIKAGTCRLKILSQGDITGTILFNVAEAVEVEFAEVSSLSYAVLESGVFCPLPKPGEYENASIQGNMLLEGSNGFLKVE